MNDPREPPLRYASAELGAVLQRPDNPFLRAPAPGHLRGIDFYRARGLVGAVALGIATYAHHHKRLPALARPVGWGEKVLCAKYFMPIPLPTCADKLAVERYVPESRRGAVRGHDVVWASNTAALPPDDEIPPGDYWLKANHGSSMNRKLAWPPSREQRVELERLAAKWLASPYGLAWGEWWYSTIERKVLLCRHVDSGGVPAIDFGFYTANGVPIMVAVGTFTLEHRAETTSFYDPDWRLLDVTRAGRVHVRRERPPQYEAMLAVAAEIARGFDVLRVDFICPLEGPARLSELTLCPASGTAVFQPPSFDVELGRRWDISAWFDV